jgi:hypothetical protein
MRSERFDRAPTADRSSVTDRHAECELALFNLAPVSPAVVNLARLNVGVLDLYYIVGPRRQEQQRHHRCCGHHDRGHHSRPGKSREERRPRGVRNRLSTPCRRLRSDGHGRSDRLVGGVTGRRR